MISKRVLPGAQLWFGLSIGLTQFNLLSPGAWNYPATPVGDTVHSYGAVQLADPFAWLEEKEDPRVEPWFRAQDAFARDQIARISGRDQLHARIREIDDAKEVLVYSFDRVGERYFYLKQEIGEEVGILYYRDGLGGAEQRLVDPADFARSDGIYSIDHFSPNHAGDKVAVAIAASGSEIPDLYLIDVASAEVSDAVIARIRSRPAWLPDDSGFFYTQMRPIDPLEARVERYSRMPAKLHRIGSDPQNDPVLVSYDYTPELGLSTMNSPFIIPLQESPWALLYVSYGVERNIGLFKAKLADVLNGTANWQRLIDREDRIESLLYHDDTLYLLSTKDSPRRKIVAAQLEPWDAALQRVVVAESERIITSMTIASDTLFFIAMDGGIDRLFALDLATKATAERELQLPLIGRVTFLGNDWREPDLFISLTSWSQAAAYYRWDPESNAITEVTLRPVGPYDRPDGMVVERHLVRSHDGVEVPLTLIYQSGLKRDGDNIVLLYGYGAYGQPQRPGFGPIRLAWLEQGAIYAVAHVRGGGEFGKEWHDGGHLERKRNSWLDFHACAEFLIRENYSRPARIGAMGGSMGGVLVGRAMTSRPDLYGAIVSSVGNHNPVRNHRRANGPANYPEYGNPLDPEEFPYVLAMDSYFAVRDGIQYPPVLLTCGYNDSRVDPWMPGKKAARLQQAAPAAGPFLLRVEFRAGHGGVARSDTLAQIADTYAFLFHHLGHARFSLNPTVGKP